MPSLRHLTLGLLLLSFAPCARAESPRELIVQLSAEPGADALAGHPREARARLAARLAPLLEAHGLAFGGALTDGLALSDAAAGGSASRRVGVPTRDLFAFAPERIALLEARDPAAAERARLALADAPEVDWVEPNHARGHCAVSIGPVPSARAPGSPPLRPLPEPFPNDPQFRGMWQWGLYNDGNPPGQFGGRLRADVHAVEAWRLGVGSNDVKLAIADTGVDPNHPDLAGRLPDARPRITDAINVTREPVPAVTDSFGHGTPVAGIALARTNNGISVDTSGVAGVCGGDGGLVQGARFVPIKISAGHSGEASSFDIARAVLHATSVGARAMNLSYAGDSPSRLERGALTYGLLRGCVVVAAAGNRGASFPTRPQYPAAFAAEGLCLQVGASNTFDERARFSSHGPGLDFVAPGEGIWTTFMTYPSFFGATYPGVVAASGTSFAAPFATGAVGLLAAARPELRENDFQVLLRESADDIGVPGLDEETAYGRLNLARALAAVDPAFGIWHDEVAADAVREGDTDSLRIGESGPGTLDHFRGVLPARRLDVSATVALPDSFLDAYRVWPRAGGTFSVRGDFRLPYFTPFAAVAAKRPRDFTLAGHLYQVLSAGCPTCTDDYVPLPPDQARFGFTVIGRVDRAPVLTVGEPAGATSASYLDTLTIRWSASDADTVTSLSIGLVVDGIEQPLASASPSAGVARVPMPCLATSWPFGVAARLRVTARDDHGRPDATVVERPLTLRPVESCVSPPSATTPFAAGPSPFRGALQLRVPSAGWVTVFDAGGRAIRRLRVEAGSFTWSGAGPHGEDAGPGLYFVRFEGPGASVTRRVVKLAR